MCQMPAATGQMLLGAAPGDLCRARCTVGPARAGAVLRAPPPWGRANCQEISGGALFWRAHASGRHPRARARAPSLGRPPLTRADQTPSKLIRSLCHILARPVMAPNSSASSPMGQIFLWPRALVPLCFNDLQCQNSIMRPFWPGLITIPDGHRRPSGEPVRTPAKKVNENDEQLNLAVVFKKNSTRLPAISLARSLSVSAN